MSTVLWANVLVNGVVVSDESDKRALYKYAKKLDKISKALNVTHFLSVQDFTDIQFNLSDQDLPEGMGSTNDLMAKAGVWVSGEEAVEMLQKLINYISSNKTKFGFLANESEAVINELTESLISANKAQSENGKFNFSVVM